MRYSQNDVICLAILTKLEAFRVKLESGRPATHENPDWVVRMCEATVAEYTQFKNRASWVAELKEGGK